MINIKENQSGFTLIELIVVIAIIGIILILALPQVSKLQEANKNRKYEVYQQAVESGAKLYVDSHARDLFGNNNSGCVTVNYSELKTSNVLKDFSSSTVTCSNNDETYVQVRKVNDTYRYNVALTCRENGEVVYQKEVDETFTCSSNPDTSEPQISITPTPHPDWVRSDELTVKIIVSDESGLQSNTSVKYYWVNNSDEKVSEEYTYNFNNKEDTLKVNFTIPKKNIVDETGEYYLVVEPYMAEGTSGVQDVLGNNKSLSEKFGPYKIDNTKPSCGNTEGEKTTWTTEDFTIKQYCNDSESGCVENPYTKKFSTTTTTYKFTIKDKAGNTNQCEVDVYLNKDQLECGTVEGESTSWTNKDRTISVACEGGSCSKAKFEKTFTTNGTTDNIVISDKNGNTLECRVNKYIDKTKPTCGSSSISSDGKTVTVGCSDSDSKCTSNSFQASIPSGVNTVSVTISDNAGNSRACSVDVSSVNPPEPEPDPEPPEEDGVQTGEACERGGDSVCWFGPMGNTVDKFSTQYANGDFDFDVTIMYTQSGVNWQCYTGSNKGFNWFGTSLYGGFRCWEGSACYNNMISQKPTSSSGSGGFGGIANGISSCDNLVGF